MKINKKIFTLLIVITILLIGNRKYEKQGEQFTKNCLYN